MATAIPNSAANFHQAAAPAIAPVVKTIGLSDLRDALRAGWSDFLALRSHAVMPCLICPVLGIVLARVMVGYLYRKVAEPGPMLSETVPRSLRRRSAADFPSSVFPGGRVDPQAGKPVRRLRGLTSACKLLRLKCHA